MPAANENKSRFILKCQRQMKIKVVLFKYAGGNEHQQLVIIISHQKKTILYTFDNLFFYPHETFQSINFQQTAQCGTF
jgi:hypothetical protein